MFQQFVQTLSAEDFCLLQQACAKRQDSQDQAEAQDILSRLSDVQRQTIYVRVKPTETILFIREAFGCSMLVADKVRRWVQNNPPTKQSPK